jgi:DNA (cytosine-5)-methyltransferase 1
VKPPYRLLTMAEIRATARNGYRVVSTFSGCGGSCLGFEMEGFTVLYASEFIPAAADTYEANHAGVPVDRRDIRNVDPAEILEVAKLAAGELDVLEGSPPCASFSMSGKREKHWGEVKQYSSTKQRTDDLFYEYARIRDGLRPKVFVAENVTGLVRGVSRGYFLDILARLSEGYRVEARILDAQWLGVPQARKRLIFVGVRDDLDAKPAFPTPLAYRYSIADVLGIRSSFGERITHDPETGTAITLDGYAVGREYPRVRIGSTSNRYMNLSRPAFGRPAPTLLATARRGTATVVHPTECRDFTVAELRLLGSFPADFVLTGSYEQRAERIGRAVPPRMMAAVARAVRDNILGGLP